MSAPNPLRRGTLALTVAALCLVGAPAALATPTSPSPTPSGSSSTPTPVKPNPTPTHSAPTSRTTPTSSSRPKPSHPGSPAPSATSPSGPTKLDTPTSAAPIPVSKAQKAAAAKAAADKASADKAISLLAARIATQTKLINTLTASSSTAEQQYTAQIPIQQKAVADAALATKQMTAANRAYNSAHTAFISIVVANYESGTGPGSFSSSGAASLLLADNPGDAMQRVAMEQMIANNQATVMTRMQQTLKTRRAASARQKSTLASVTSATARLTALRNTATANLAKANATVTSLRADLAKANYSQEEALAVLSNFLGGWSSVAPAQASALDHRYMALAKKVKNKPLPVIAAKDKGKWTPALGQAVVNRAIQWLGTPYAWDGGTTAGPTKGVCAGDGAQNDCHIVGFDCSGLALYSWGPFLSMKHYAATQYGYGKVHPAVNKLLPGDLVFWSSNGAVSGIHHVAIYVGDGLVIQAPQSGDIVRITPLAYVSSGYFGATRPMS